MRRRGTDRQRVVNNGRKKRGATNGVWGRMEERMRERALEGGRESFPFGSGRRYSKT